MSLKAEIEEKQHEVVQEYKETKNVLQHLVYPFVSFFNGFKKHYRIYISLLTIVFLTIGLLNIHNQLVILFILGMNMTVFLLYNLGKMEHNYHIKSIAERNMAQEETEEI